MNQHLSEIDTLWTMVLHGNLGSQSDQSAQEQLLQRYGGAVYRYLLAVVRDADVADDLSQEFALRLVKGGFKNAKPERGKFRNFVKTAVLNLVNDYHRRKKKRQPILAANIPEPSAEHDVASDIDQEFLDSWRQELLSRAWDLLKSRQEQAGQPFYTVLRFRADHPDLNSSQIAEQLSETLDRKLSSTGIRQILYRARKNFAEFIVDDVRHSLQNPNSNELRDELQMLGLLEYCGQSEVDSE